MKWFVNVLAVAIAVGIVFCMLIGIPEAFVNFLGAIR